MLRSDDQTEVSPVSTEIKKTFPPTLFQLDFFFFLNGGTLLHFIDVLRIYRKPTTFY